MFSKGVCIKFHFDMSEANFSLVKYFPLFLKNKNCSSLTLLVRLFIAKHRVLKAILPKVPMCVF